ncbi:MAG TPA: hypothetical protein VMM18_05730 [Gemmatimonadaceae bacterium]|nr:hypothetical protein [Gemmatimonadaceae bacterium]
MAGDSTYWVRAETAGPVEPRTTGTRVRASPLYLARLDGRFHEIYLADDDRSHYEAILIGQRLYRRDIIDGDSLLVFEDTLVAGLARSWARANPGSLPLDADEEASEEPEIYATADVEILALHGHVLSYEYHVDVETRDGDASHMTRRGALDLRRGAPLTLRSLYGADASRIEAEGRRRFAAVTDSVLAHGSAVARRAGEALAGFVFDPTSFSIAQLEGESAVTFLVPGESSRAEWVRLELPPIAAGAPPWWEEIRATLPVTTDDPLVDRWPRPDYDVLARYASDADTVVLSLRGTSLTWRLGVLAAPVHRIEWLDAPPIDSVQRAALSRAFDEAELYDTDRRIAATGDARATVRVHAAVWTTSRVPVAATAGRRHRAPHGRRTR